MEALDDKDIEAAQTLVMLSTPSRGQGSRHGQRASAIEPRSGSHPKGSMQSSTPHARQSIDPTTNISMHSSISNPAQPVRRSSSSSRPVPAQISTDTMTASDKALQAYLLRQQLLAGIAPENLIPMRPPTTGQTQGGNQGIVNRPNNPSLVQITNNALEFTMYLNVEELVNLLSISKPFNRFVKRNCFDIIKRQATRDAPESSQIFPFRCYSRLCIDNTKARRQSIPARDIVGENNLAPSFCWLQMIIYREKTVKKIMENMLAAGYGLPKPCEPVIKKLWFIMDIPDNRRREWTMMNRNLWQDIELFFAMIFIAQLDMLLRNKRESITGRLYHLLMAQPTMTVLWDVLRDAALRSEFETLKYFVRWKYTPLPHETDLYVYGVPPQEVGALQYEGYGRHERVTKFIQPDELILREMARRQLNLGDMYQDIFLTGDRARYYSRFTQAATSWDEEMKREAGAQGIDWQNVVRLN
ncbi:hypothetical protein APSETT444_002227 [Aspergillus pseudonomiae]